MSYRLSVKDFQLKKTGASDISTLKILTGTSGTSQIYLGDTAVENVGLIKYNHLTDTFSVNTSSTERFKIDSVGKITIPNQIIVQGGANIPWTTGKSYSVDDVVLKDGYLIRCLTAHTSGTYTSDVTLGYWQMAHPMKNYVINSNMAINQRGHTTSTPFTPGVAGYGLDRWKLVYDDSTSKLSASQVDIGTTLEGVSKYALSIKNTVGTATNAPGHMQQQALEIVDSKYLLGKVATVSFWGRRTQVAALNGTSNFQIGYAATESNPFGVSATIGASFTPTQTWTRYSATGIMPTSAVATGSVIFVISVVGCKNLNDEFQFTGCMINEGPAPAPFQTAGVNYQAELAMCYRYYYQSFSTLGTGNISCGPYMSDSFNFFNGPSFPVTMRVAPTFTIVTNGVTGRLYRTANGAVLDSTVTSNVSTGGVIYFYTSVAPTAGIQYRYDYTANAEI